MGAEEQGVKTYWFESPSEIPQSPYNVVVGSVEVCQQWLSMGGYPEISPMSLWGLESFLGRNSISIPFEVFRSQPFPLFVKPASTIKAFTGFVAKSYEDSLPWIQDYRGDLLVQDPVDIVSEYRAYINNNTLMGIKHYQGNPLRFPNSGFIVEVLNKAIGIYHNHSYTLDFGVLADGSTILIEPNDGWAIGNYGLEPRDYWKFVKDRWLQITGIRKQMDFKIKNF